MIQVHFRYANESASIKRNLHFMSPHSFAQKKINYSASKEVIVSAYYGQQINKGFGMQCFGKYDLNRNTETPKHQNTNFYVHRK